MTTRTLRRFAVLPALVLAAAVTACDDDDPTATDDALVGTFSATEAVFTDEADPNNQFDVIAEDGTFDMEFRSDQTFRSELNLPERDPVVRTGSFALDGSNLTLTEDGVSRNATLTRSGSDLIIADPGDRFAFDNEVTVPARMNARLRPALE